MSACYHDDVFNQYVVPDQSISAKVTEITGLSVNGGVMCHNGLVVDAVSVAACLTSVVDWLKQYRPALLVAHNCKCFDSYRLVYQLSHLNDPGLLTVFTNVVTGFADTLAMFRNVYKG
jgi:DNA polymerase III alpha subunit (gram-positive type)